MDAKTLINKAIKILSEPEVQEGFKEDIKKLQYQLELADNNRYRLGVIGVTSAGKSTLINALLGEELLPSEAKPSSNQLVSCRKGLRQATIHFNNDKRITYSGSQLNSALINKYGNEQLNAKNKAGVTQIEIQSPHIPFDESIIIIDSPGLDAYGLEGHEQITMENLLPSIDFCLYITTCKTNSDGKMLSILNSISRHHKPVIIVQNMIDSLKASADGLKNKKEVAEEYLRRIQRIIDKSDVKDKSAVNIVQISAKYAIDCRAVTCMGKKLSAEGNRKWKESNFDNFKSLVNKVFLGLKPDIEGFRIENIIKELDAIIATIDCKLSGKKELPVPPYLNLKNELHEKYTFIETQFDEVFKKINSSISRWGQRERMYRSDIDSILCENRIWVKEITTLIQEHNDYVSSVCSKLNISVRDIRFNFTPSQMRTLRVATTTVTKKQKKRGFWAPIQRFCGIGGYEMVTEEVTDFKKTRENAIAFLKAVKDDFHKQIEKWRNGVSKTMILLEERITMSEQQYEAAKKRNINLAKQGEVKKRLKMLIAEARATMPHRVKKENFSQPIKVETIKQEIAKQTYLTYRLSRYVLSKLHQSTFEAIVGGGNCHIYSWDQECVNRFLSYIGKQQPTREIKVLSPQTFPANIQQPRQPANILFFVNFTQPGTAKKQLASINISLLRKYSGQVIFVIQDLQETLNGNDFRNALNDMRMYFSKELMTKKFLIYPVHYDPLYAITMYECQTHGVNCHNDEVTINANLRKYFSKFIDDIQKYSDVIRAFSTSKY